MAKSETVFINTFPRLKKYFITRTERHESRNFLFRLVGLEIFLKIMPTLKNDEASLVKAIEVLTLLPRRFTEKPFVGVLYSATEEKILSGTRLSIRLLRHMLGYDSQKTAELRKDYAEALGVDVASIKLPRRITRP